MWTKGAERRLNMREVIKKALRLTGLLLTLISELI
jgi:hypothetical protein